MTNTLLGDKSRLLKGASEIPTVTATPVKAVEGTIVRISTTGELQQFRNGLWRPLSGSYSDAVGRVANSAEVYPSNRARLTYQTGNLALLADWTNYNTLVEDANGMYNSSGNGPNLEYAAGLNAYMAVKLSVLPTGSDVVSVGIGTGGVFMGVRITSTRVYLVESAGTQTEIGIPAVNDLFEFQMEPNETIVGRISQFWIQGSTGTSTIVAEKKVISSSYYTNYMGYGRTSYTFGVSGTRSARISGLEVHL
jgi:hypothetical protein